MKKKVIINDVRGGVTTGYTFEDIEVGQTVTIIAQDENGQKFEATGEVIEFDEV
jgi:hypothetical protein